MRCRTQIVVRHHHLILAALANKDAIPELVYFASASVLESAPPCLLVDASSPLFSACQAITVENLQRQGLRAALTECYAQTLFKLRREWYESGDPAKLESYSVEAYEAARPWIDAKESSLFSLVVLHKAIAALACLGRPPTNTLPPVSSPSVHTLDDWDEIVLADLFSR